MPRGLSERIHLTDLPPHWCGVLYWGSLNPFGTPKWGPCWQDYASLGKFWLNTSPKQGEPSVSPAGCLLGSWPCLARLSFWHTSCQKGGLSAGPSVPRAQMLGFGGKFVILCSSFIFIYGCIVEICWKNAPYTKALESSFFGWGRGSYGKLLKARA